VAVLVIRTANHLREDGTVNTARHRRGDVIAALPDGHVFSERERANPAWRFWELPGVPVRAAERLLRAATDEEDADKTEAGVARLRAVARRRAYRLSVLRVAFLETRPVMKAALIAKLKGDAVNWADSDLTQLVRRFDDERD
jgi:hypothetical protein